MAVAPGFALLHLMEGELAAAAEELRWRGDAETLEWIERIERRVEAIHHLLHHVYDLGLLRTEHAVPLDALRPFLEWVRCGEGDPPEVPAPLTRTAARITDLWRELREGRASPVPLEPVA